MTFSRHPVRIGRLRAFHFRHDAISSFVAERIKDEGETADKALDAALAGFLQGFEVVIIQLDENDDAQEIFASLNGLGKPLAPFDLIRNDAERPTMSVFSGHLSSSRAGRSCHRREKRQDHAASVGAWRRCAGCRRSGWYRAYVCRGLCDLGGMECRRRQTRSRPYQA